ncbi:urea amidolyase associated protein UAAP1 [Aquirhabdus sp.]|uniref:urea amidolyase associated protein UAAP1 n=1 Tax=Aquirhabdus sp. TaxID=2824160 RepID=UPI00396C7D88
MSSRSSLTTAEKAALSIIPADQNPLWEDLLPGGFHWSARIRRGTVLRLTAQATSANLAALFFNAEEKLERYNAPDTLKAQHTAFLTRGHVCYSDMGRILCSVVTDTAGWNDAFCGVSDAEQIKTQYGLRDFGAARNGMYRSGREGLLIEMGKWGLGKRDLVTNVNFFSKVSADDAGKLVWNAEHTQAGDIVELRFEMDTLVILSAAPHPLDPATTYDPAAILLSAFTAAPVAADDVCRTSCEQNGRGFQNTERYFAAMPSSVLHSSNQAGA